MRDLLFLSLFAPLPLLSLVHPWSGLLAFGWIAFLKPQAQLWSFAADVPFNLIIAITTALGWAVSRERKTFSLDLTTALIIALVAIAAFSTFTSLAPAISKVEFGKLMKTMAFLFLLKVMATSKVRLHGYIWLMAFAMGFFGLNGGALFIVSGGHHQLAGPPQSEIGDRNHLALAMLLAVPLMNYLRLQSRHRWMQLCLMGAMVMTVLAVFATYSRGGFLGLIAMGVFLWWKSKKKIVAMAALLMVAVGLYSVAPDSWKARMGTIETAQTEDNSFKLRLLAWETYLNAAFDRPLTGAGLYALQTRAVFFRYAPPPDETDVRNDRPCAAHSVYFQVLGDLGFVAFSLYVALLAVGFWNARRIILKTRARPDLEWMADLARMIHVSIIAFCVSGAALSMAFYDYFLSLLIVLSTVRAMAEAAAPAAARLPVDDAAAAPVDARAIAWTWRKAAYGGGARLHRRPPGARLASRGGTS
jgi:probable O-glycosylation ligase (exosortase A-associated)